ncbi:von Willebrand factor A domain-containing protein 1 [Pelodytes ibericus]
MSVMKQPLGKRGEEQSHPSLKINAARSLYTDPFRSLNTDPFRFHWFFFTTMQDTKPGKYDMFIIALYDTQSVASKRGLRPSLGLPRKVRGQVCDSQERSEVQSVASKRGLRPSLWLPREEMSNRGPLKGNSLSKTEEKEHPNIAPDSEGDLLFLLDSSGSVSYHEFAKVKEFIGDLLRPFTFGSEDVQASIVHISTEPALEFPFNQHGSNQDIQKALLDIKQRMGDTNTGKALSYVKDNISNGKFGSRAEVPKVMVWVTDGLSTDDISQPMKLLKDMGVTVFIVSTGTGNYLDLSEAASSEDHLYFVDVDDLPIITKELRDAIIELIRANRLKAHDITTTSFRLSWPNVLSQSEGESYLLEYSLESDSSKRIQKGLPGYQTGIVLGNLTSNTTYRITLTPDSNVHFIQPQTIQVSTLPESIRVLELQIHDVTSTSFRLTWPRLLSQVKGESYVLEYSQESDTIRSIRKSLNGDQTDVTLDNLAPNTIYRITLSPRSNVQSIRPQTIQVSTLPEPIQEIQLGILDVTRTSFRLTWPRLLSHIRGESYVLEYSQESDTRSVRMNLNGDQTEVLLGNLTPNTTYRVTLVPKSKVQSFRPNTIQVSTLPEPIQLLQLQVRDLTPTRFRITWPRLSPHVKVESYILEYSPESDLSRSVRKSLSGDQTDVVIDGLAPNTTYRVNLTPRSNVQSFKPHTIQVTTLHELIQVTQLQVRDLTPTRFRITWPRLSPHIKVESYILEYSQESDLSRSVWKSLSGDQTDVVIDGLAPNTTYRVSLTPRSNVQSFKANTIQVTTLHETIQAIQLLVRDITPTSLRLTWPRLLSQIKGESYVLEYSLEPDLTSNVKKILNGDQTGIVLDNLTPNTTYRVTVTPESNSQFIQPRTIKVSTLPEPIKGIQLQVHDITASSFRLTWPRVLSQIKEETYLLEYSAQSNLGQSVQKIVPGDQTTVVLDNLTSNTTYRVTLTPRSNVQFIRPHTIQASTLPKPIQAIQLEAHNITPTSLRLVWPKMSQIKVESYLLEYSLESDKSRSLWRRMNGDQTGMVLSNLTPNTVYRVTLTPESNLQVIQPQTIQVSTLPALIGPSQILISESSSHSFRVSWSPKLDNVAGYEIQYGPLPSNTVHRVKVDGTVNSTVLENLNSNTTYLVTVAAIFKHGGEKALSAIACTDEKDAKVSYLHVKELDSDRIKATWGSADGDVQGYHVRCRRQAGRSSVVSVAPQTHNMLFTNMAVGTTNKICVKPVYRNGAGKNLCRTVRMHPATSRQELKVLQSMCWQDPDISYLQMPKRSARTGFEGLSSKGIDYALFRNPYTCDNHLL